MAFKLVCFDLDGTLIDNTHSIWQTVHTALGTDDATRRQASEDFFSGRISYREWAEKDVTTWKEARLTKQKLLEIMEGFTPMEGAHETLKALNDAGIKTAVVSGSLRIVLERFFPEHRFDYVFINDLEFDGDSLRGVVTGVKSTLYDQHGKAEALDLMCEKEKISHEETVFIGDHDNDVEIAKKAGLSIAFNCRSQKLKEICDCVIDEKDLRRIIPKIISA